jgi:ribosomal protein L12E/L44/L45/RPP1/RPP2
VKEVDALVSSAPAKEVKVEVKKEEPKKVEAKKEAPKKEKTPPKVEEDDGDMGGLFD